MNSPGAFVMEFEFPQILELAIRTGIEITPATPEREVAGVQA